MKQNSVMRLLLGLNALSLGLSEFSELEMYSEVKDWEGALDVIEHFKSVGRINDDDYQALVDLFKVAAASL